MTPAEWDALPWWQQRMYVEGLNAEFGPQDGTPRQAPKEDPFVASGRAGEFSALGYNEQSL